MKRGDKVRFKAPTLEGTILKRRVTPDDEVEFLVAWQEGDEKIERWFDEPLLEIVPAPAAAAEEQQP
jgi:hypothetical protein